ncbi:hypothetical protein Plhal304r1_c018g0065251 [Plasmopara halstedii]
MQNIVFPCLCCHQYLSFSVKNTYIASIMHFGIFKAFIIATFVACSFTSIGANDVVSTDIKARPSRRLPMFSGVSKIFSSSGDDAAKAAVKMSKEAAEDAAKKGRAIFDKLMTTMKGVYKNEKEAKDAISNMLKLPATKMDKFKKVAKMVGLGIGGALAIFGTYKLTVGADGPPRAVPQTQPTT